MNHQEEIIHALALKFIPGIGNITVRKLIQHFSSATGVWNVSKKELKEFFGENSPIVPHFQKKEYLIHAEDEINLALQNSIQILYYTDENFPILLKEIPDSPIIIFARGNLIQQNKKLISIVGTRNITSYGKEFIEEFLTKLKTYPINIISGFAFGVDICAQKKCVELGIPTFGVLAHGLKYLYPKTNYEVGMEILANQGGFYSEYLFKTKPERDYFLQRNRIIAGLSSATIVVESAYGGGAMTTANYANQYDREVFAVPGRITDKFSGGCNLLIKRNQAQILTSANDIISYFNLDETKINKIKTKQLPLLFDCSEEEKQIVELIFKKQRIQIDELSLLMKIPTFKLMSMLLNLELKNIVRPLSGKYFELF